MMLEKGLNHLLRQIDEKVEILQESLGKGGATDYADYQKKCGEIQGLLTARLNILDLRKNLEHSDDE
jgi:hypothetical protein